MLAWLPYVGVILSALTELARLLIDLAKEKNDDAIKECSTAIEDARKTGDTAKLTKLIDQMKVGGPCQ
jgi:uncharacterized membrane protein (DUF106 family)